MDHKFQLSEYVRLKKGVDLEEEQKVYDPDNKNKFSIVASYYASGEKLRGKRRYFVRLYSLQADNPSAETLTAAEDELELYG